MTGAVTHRSSGPRGRISVPSVAVALVLTATLTFAETAAAQGSLLIPALNRRDHVYDPVRNVLFISTAIGTIERYDVRSESLLPPFAVGLWLNGIDITPDSRFLYTAEHFRGAIQGLVRRVDADTGAAQNITYNLSFGEGGAWDVAIGAHGKALVSTMYEGSDGVPARELVLATDVINVRVDTGDMRQSSQIARGESRTFFFIAEPNSSAGPVRTYDSATDSFPASGTTGAFLGSAMAAVNRDGSVAALEVGGAIHICDPSLNTLNIVAGDAGMIFHPGRDLLFAALSGTDEVVAYDTETWTEVWRGPIGEDVPASTPMGNGEMSIDRDGNAIFMSTPTGVRVVPVPVALTDVFSDGFEDGTTSAWSDTVGR